VSPYLAISKDKVWLSVWDTFITFGSTEGIDLRLTAAGTNVACCTPRNPVVRFLIFKPSVSGPEVDGRKMIAVRVGWHTKNVKTCFRTLRCPNTRKVATKPGVISDNTKHKPEDSIFAKIVAKKLHAKIVYEDDKAMCFHDTNPVAPVHLLVVPKKPIGGVGDLQPVDSEIVGHCIYVASLVAKQQGVAQGYRLVINEGKHGQQSVRWLHVHLIGGKQLGWPPSSEL